MRLFVTVQPGSGEVRIESLGEGKFKVWVKERPVKGLANKAVVYVLSKHLNILQSQICIVSGHTSRMKTIEIVGIKYLC